MRTVLAAVDRVFDTPLGRLGAYVLLVILASVGFGYVQAEQARQHAEQIETCEAGRRFRLEEFPAAIAQHDRDLGAALMGAESFDALPAEDRETIEAFIRTSGPNLRAALPTRDCN